MIEPEQVVGIVGPFDSGKSMMLDLLLRFYKPERGNILLDDKPIESYQVSSVRRRMGMYLRIFFFGVDRFVIIFFLWHLIRQKKNCGMC